MAQNMLELCLQGLPSLWGSTQEGGIHVSPESYAFLWVTSRPRAGNVKSWVRTLSALWKLITAGWGRYQGPQRYHKEVQKWQHLSLGDVGTIPREGSPHAVETTLNGLVLMLPPSLGTSHIKRESIGNSQLLPSGPFLQLSTLPVP